MRRPVWLALSVALLLAALYACGGSGDETQACTAASCRSGLGVTLTNPPATAYRVEATANGETTVHAQDCASGGQCFIFFTDFIPVRVSISVVTASATVAYDAIPTYTASRPNGPNCPPECRSATVTVSGSTADVSVYKYAGSVQCGSGGLTLSRGVLERTRF